MRLMLLADSLGNGGAERQLALLAAGLPAAWQRRVCALGGGPFESHLRAKGVPVEVLARRSRLDPALAAGLWRTLAASPPDVVHSWGWMSTALAGPLCRLMGLPLIDGTIRAGAVRRMRLGAVRPDHPRLGRIGMACATSIVANSRAGLEAWGIGSKKGVVVHNGFDWSRLRSQPIAAETGGRRRVESEDGFTVVMTARMTRDKDYSTVIDAARLLRQAGRTWRFILVGDGEERSRLIREAADLVHEGAVEFPEPSLEVLGYVRGADVGVLMTNVALHQEGCSNTIMEYMACGLPVVCSEGGGNREVVVDGTTGLVIPPSDARELAASLVFLHDNASERRAMGEAGRRRIEESFSVERMVAGFVRVYENALSASRRD